ncbi:MAG: cyanophycinase [Flavobacteriaceae bacterium]|nr:cyanophycinase [Flavobacteriaceae bacterium]
MQLIKGTLIPIGGNEDKGNGKSEIHTLEFIDEGILSRIVKESGGKDTLILIIPTASSIPVEIGENYLAAFKKLGCTQVKVLDIRTRQQSENQIFIDLIKKADCVMFSGGDQSKITKIISGSTIHEILIEKYRNENFVIAGTSAGAMCMSKEMIAGGSGTEVLRKGVVNMSIGMGFIPGLIIDSHFIRRGRFGRLVESVAKFPNLLGVGLAEDTGLVIKNCNEFEVIGSGMVILFDGNKLMHNNEELLKQGTPMTLTNLITQVLSNGDSYNIKKRIVNILPIDAPFV